MRKAILLFIIIVWAPILMAEFEPGKFYASGPIDQKKISLTFDDGPGPHTERFLEVLAKYGIQGTFFMQGEQVKKNPETARLVAEQGHEIGSHTSGHVNYKKRLREIKKILQSHMREEGAAIKLVQEELYNDMDASINAIRKATGVRPRVLRMPHGIDRPWVNHAAQKAGVVLVNWTFGADWQKDSVEELKSAYADAIKPGAILLFHDGGGHREKSLALVESVIQTAQNQEYQIVPISELLDPGL